MRENGSENLLEKLKGESVCSTMFVEPSWRSSEEALQRMRTTAGASLPAVRELMLLQLMLCCGTRLLLLRSTECDSCRNPPVRYVEKLLINISKYTLTGKHTGCVPPPLLLILHAARFGIMYTHLPLICSLSLSFYLLPFPPTHSPCWALRC